MKRVSAKQVGALVVALVPLVIYLLTLQNGLTPGELQGGDPITHQYAQATLRFANAPGYPIFTMLGWLWFQFSALLSPLLNPIERLTLYSTLYAIPSLVLLYYIVLKVTADGRRQTTDAELPSVVHHPPSTVIFAVLGTLFFAFTYFWWYYSVSSENYSSGTLNTLLIIALALRWQERREAPFGERALLWLCFACGLSLAHLLTVALAVPAVIAFVVGQQPDYLRRPKLLLKIFIATALPLLSYAYIFWRGAEHPEWRGQGNWSSTWAWFVDFIRTQQGQAELTWSWDGVPWEMLRVITNELTVFLFVAGCVGLCLLPRWRAVLFVGIVAVYAPELYVDRYGNWFQTIIALYPLFLLGTAVLTKRIYVLFTEYRTVILLKGVLVAVWLLLVVNRLLLNYPTDNLRDRPTATGLGRGWALLADEPASRAHIVGTYAEDLALDYLTQIWGARRDVQTLKAADIKAHVDAPLYVSREAMPLVQKSLPSGVYLSSHGLRLVALTTHPVGVLPSSSQPLKLPLAHGLELLGFETRRVSGQLDLALYWRAAQSIDVDMAISLRPMRGERRLLQDDQPLQIDSAHPVGGFYPMTRWSAGEVVRDDYALPLEAANEADRVHVVLYRATSSGFENLAECDVPLR